MKKELLIIEIVCLLFCFGFSGCTNITVDNWKSANIILKNVTYTPVNPVEKENIHFTIKLENTGDKNSTTFKIILKGIDRYNKPFQQSSLCKINGHSQEIVTISIDEDKTNEGIQCFEIQMYGSITNYTYIPLQTIEIDVEPESPEIYYITTGDDHVAGDFVYVYFECRNVNHNHSIEIDSTIKVYHIASSIEYYNNTNSTIKQLIDLDNWANVWSFKTYTSPNTWQTGEYRIDITVEDKITRKIATATVNFNLT